MCFYCLSLNNTNTQLDCYSQEIANKPGCLILSDIMFHYFQVSESNSSLFYYYIHLVIEAIALRVKDSKLRDYLRQLIVQPNNTLHELKVPQ